MLEKDSHIAIARDDILIGEGADDHSAATMFGGDVWQLILQLRQIDRTIVPAIYQQQVSPSFIIEGHDHHLELCAVNLATALDELNRIREQLDHGGQKFAVPIIVGVPPFNQEAVQEAIDQIDVFVGGFTNEPSRVDATIVDVADLVFDGIKEIGQVMSRHRPFLLHDVPPFCDGTELTLCFKRKKVKKLYRLVSTLDTIQLL